MLEAIGKFLSHADIIIPAALTIYGWRFIYKEGNRLAKRNEALNLFHIARNMLENINKEAEKIWSENQSLNELDEAKLTLFCAEFELCIKQINKHYCEIPIGAKEILSLRRALTGDPYPINGKAATSEQRIKEIKIKISELSLSLLDKTYEAITA